VANPSSTIYYPPVSFYFTVSIAGVGTGNDSSFQEVSGLSAERGTIEIKEGGENRFSYHVPDRAKYGNLVLKRGVMLANSGLATWCETVLTSDLSHPITTQQIVVSLLDADTNPLVTWNFVDAWPVKWSVADLSADKSELTIETMELAYTYFTKNTGANTSANSGASQTSKS
jgi:phage tail-like protein